MRKGVKHRQLIGKRHFIMYEFVKSTNIVA
jgi:hypothetical protein